MERGCKYGDFFDRFLVELEKIMTNSPDKNETFHLLKEANKECFEGKTLKDFSETFFWGDYIEDGIPKILFAPHWTLRKKFEKISPGSDYVAYAERFIDMSTKIINNRAALMIAALEKKL